MFKITPTIVIALAGGAGVGKDTLAEHYLKPYGYYPIALADEIKYKVVERGEASYEEVFITKPAHIRNLLQQEGTERGRNVYGENYWVHQLFARLGYYNIRWGLERFVITDVRFPNEVEAVQARGGKVLQVVAPQRYAANGLSDQARIHPSERALDGFTAFDGVINNDLGQEALVGRQLLITAGVVTAGVADRFKDVRFAETITATAAKFNGTVTNFDV